LLAEKRSFLQIKSLIFLGIIQKPANKSRMLFRIFVLCALWLLIRPLSADSSRRPANEAELKAWLRNMVWFHHFTTDEIRTATGLSEAEIQRAAAKFNIRPETRPARKETGALVVLPYPGGRHPRIGFLEGAIDPQRETKLSIFTPWDETSYVVADLPEAIWSNLGLTYLAHTHVPTIWSKQNIDLPKLEWTQLANGNYRMERPLPNGIRFGTLAHSTSDAVLMKMWLFNGTTNTLSDLRVQNCVMLKGASGFNQQTNANKIFRPPFAAVQSGDHWIIEGWKPIHRCWGNAPCPCLHADPKFPDTNPGQTNTIYGQVSFYTGKEIESEFNRIESTWDERFNPLR
jgi:hypothetical protein